MFANTSKCLNHIFIWAFSCASRCINNLSNAIAKTVELSEIVKEDFYVAKTVKKISMIRNLFDILWLEKVDKLFSMLLC